MCALLVIRECTIVTELSQYFYFLILNLQPLINSYEWMGLIQTFYMGHCFHLNLPLYVCACVRTRVCVLLFPCELALVGLSKMHTYLKFLTKNAQQKL